jgi:hypothetical protein
MPNNADFGPRIDIILRRLTWHFAFNFGSDALLMVLPLAGADYPALEQIELSATVHLALHELELCDLTFGLAI